MTPTDRSTGRLAPSPTGELHVGHARTFLAAWLAARGAGGRVIFRIEDLDATRARPGMTQAATDSLRWLGLDWDEGPDVGGPHAPYVQSLRFGLYRSALETLIRTSAVYPCICTRADRARIASAPHAGDDTPIAACPCREGDLRPRRAASEGIRFAWRFRVSAQAVSWVDDFAGKVSINPAEHGDFIVARCTGDIAYQLAVVVDDAAMGITHVVRGDDLIPSTPRQILLYEALGHAVPRFAHLPLVVDASGQRLAKRDESLKLSTLRGAGVPPARLVAALARSLGIKANSSHVMPEALVGSFDLASVPKAPWVLDLRAGADAREWKEAVDS